MVSIELFVEQLTKMFEPYKQEFLEKYESMMAYLKMI
jgi:hypothetical protein